MVGPLRGGGVKAGPLRNTFFEAPQKMCQIECGGGGAWVRALVVGPPKKNSRLPSYMYIFRIRMEDAIGTYFTAEIDLDQEDDSEEEYDITRTFEPECILDDEQDDRGDIYIDGQQPEEELKKEPRDYDDNFMCENIEITDKNGVLTDDANESIKIGFPCNQCEYVATQVSSLYAHQAFKHNGIRHPCDQCQYAATTSSNLKKHKLAKHTIIRLKCDQCDYKAFDKSSLKRHVASKHEKIGYPCNVCEYVATQVSSLNAHKASKHIGLRYPCDQCSYAATTNSNLKKHKAAKHEGVRYPCEHCAYAATDKASLRKHKASKHEGIT